MHLARQGARVVALDREPELLAALSARAAAAGLEIETVAADAQDFALGRRFPLIIVPMQTVQLLPDRAAFLAAARAHLAPGGLLAIAIADALDPFDAQHDIAPLPDIRELDGTVYASRPVAVVDGPDGADIWRLRETVDPDGGHDVEEDVIHLDAVDAATLGAEGEAHGLRAEAPLRIPANDDYVGSSVVMLRG